MISTFLVSKSACMTCNNEVLKSLGSLQGVFGAEIDRSKGVISVSHTDEVGRQEISDLLNRVGFLLVEEEIKQGPPSVWGCAL
jgi:copper chaperone CopZ